MALEDLMQSGFPRSPAVAGVVDEIVRQVHPHKVYLYNQRYSVSGETTAFKLCVIAPFADKEAAEREIYLNIDSEVPFDVILYTPGEWSRLCQSPDSFARKIFLTGMVVFG